MSDLTRDFISAEPEEREFSVFPKGEYPFTILEINEFATSKAGNEKLPLKLEFRDGEDKSNVFEDLVFTEKAIFKIHQFLKCVGVPVGTRINFHDDEFRKYLKTRSGRAVLDVENYVGKDGKTREKNVVASFIYEGTSKRDSAQPAKAAPPAEEEIDDDNLPF